MRTAPPMHGKEGQISGLDARRWAAHAVEQLAAARSIRGPRLRLPLIDRRLVLDGARRRTFRRRAILRGGCRNQAPSEPIVLLAAKSDDRIIRIIEAPKAGKSGRMTALNPESLDLQ